MIKRITVIVLILFSVSVYANNNNANTNNSDSESSQTMEPSQHPKLSKKTIQKLRKKLKSHNNSDVTQINRYSTVKNGPNKAQINPLMAVSEFHFPPTVHTVGDAVHHVLANTGYKLSQHLSSQVQSTLNKSLPITQRHLGPIRIQHALEILMGQQVFKLQRDPLHRLVTFKVRSNIADSLGVNHDQ